MDLIQTTDLYAVKAKPFHVVDSRYGHWISSWSTQEEADTAAEARPYSKVVTKLKTDGCYPRDAQKREVAARAYANHKLQGRTTFQGLNISIENRKGSVRKGTDKDGKPWQVKMSYPYGYILRSEGVDGDHVDCFLGPNTDATHVYVIQTNDAEGNYDEDKCMLGFDSASEAKKAFLANYTSPKFFRSLQTIPMDEFKKKVSATYNHPQKITAALDRMLAHLVAQPNIGVGTQVTVDGLQGRGVVIAIEGGRLTVRFRNGLEVVRNHTSVHSISGRLVP